MSVRIDKPRVLQVIAGLDPAVGGPPASAIQTALALRDKGLVNDFAYVYDGEITEPVAENARVLEDAEIRVYAFPTSKRFGRSAWRWGVSTDAAAWLLRNARRYDVLHIHGAWTFTTLAALTSSRLWRRTAVLSTHESLTDFDREKSSGIDRLAKRLLRSIYLRSFDRIIVASPLEQSDSGDPQGRRTVVIPHAVAPPGLSSTNGRPRDGLRVGFLGRLHPKKNVDVLIRAIAAAGPDVELLVAGEGAELERLRTVARECDVGDRIEWLGFVDQSGKAAFLTSIDVLAMPSAYECFGVAAAEALSAGVPVVVSPQVGVSEIVARRRCGAVVEVDPEALGTLFASLSVDREQLHQYSDAARIAAAEEFSRARHGALIHDVYARSLTRKHHLPPLPAVATGMPDEAAVTVIVATLDEELHIERLLRSTRSLGQVFVVDAGSTDRTRELAEAAGATVVGHPWSGYAEQKNWALENLPIETEWVLFLDADEYLTPPVVEEIRSAVRRPDVVGFYLPEMNVFMGRPLEHAWWYPAYQLRLFRRSRGRFEPRAVHESVIVDGEVAFLRETLYHESLKGIDAFMERHVRYARLEAEEILRAREQGWGDQRQGRLFGTWPQRRRFLKVRVWYRLPGRPAIRFFWIYVVKRGFLDGRPGLVYASLLASYEALVNAKIAELQLERGEQR